MGGMDPGALPRLDWRGLPRPHLLVEFAIAPQIIPLTTWQVHRSQALGDAVERECRVGEDSDVERPGDSEVALVDVDLNQALAVRVAPVHVVRDVKVADP